MTVKVVTDSVTDLPPEICRELGITVIPLTVHFGTEVYREGIDLTSEQFYNRLGHEETFPTTSTPPPGVFAEVLDKLAEETNEIPVITLTRKLSGVYEVASQSVGLMKRKCRVEVVER